MIEHHTHCCEHRFDGLDPRYKQILIFITILNLAMFVIEMLGGAYSGSMALKADALDFLADGITYSISLWAIGKPVKLRSRVAMFKGLSLCGIGIGVFALALWRIFEPLSPEPFTMSIIGVLALAANVLSVVLLYRWRLGDANIRSVWLCSRNDAIGNIAVIAAAGAVFYFASPWPDLIVAILMSSLFLNSARQILMQARLEAQDHPQSDL